MAVVVADRTAAVADTVAAVDTTKIYPTSLSSGPSFTKAGLFFSFSIRDAAVYFSRLLHLRPQLFCLRCVTHSDAEDSAFIPRCAEQSLRIGVRRAAQLRL
jgi:hypothetical protein